jgi:hypothetical protein
MPSLFKNFFTNYNHNKRNILLKLTKRRLKQLIQESITTSLLEAMCGNNQSGQWVDGKMVCANKCAPKGSPNLEGLPECPPKKTKKAKEKEISLKKPKNRKPLVIPKPKEEAKPKPKKRTKKNPSSGKSKRKCTDAEKAHGRCKDKKQNFGKRECTDAARAHGRCDESRLQLEFEAPSNESTDTLQQKLEILVNEWSSKTPEDKELERQIIELIKQTNPNFEKKVEPLGGMNS